MIVNEKNVNPFEQLMNIPNVDIEIDGKIKIKSKSMTQEELDKMSLFKTENKNPEDVQLILG